MKLEYNLLDDNNISPKGFFCKVKIGEPECFAKIIEAWGICVIFLQGQIREVVVISSTGF